MTPKSRTYGPVTSLSELIRKRRDELGLTQTQLAQAVGVKSPDFISLVEQGFRKLNLDRIPSLSEVLRLDPIELGKMALEEQFPVFASVLISGTSAFRKTSVGGGSAAVASASAKLLAIDPSVRDPLLKLIDTYYSQATSSSRINKERASA